MSLELSYLTLCNMAVAADATSPIPADGQGSMIWSTTEGKPLGWNGTNWKLVGAIPSVTFLNDITIIASANQTAFSVSYVPGYVNVFANGYRLPKSDFSAISGNTIVLNSGVPAGTEMIFEVPTATTIGGNTTFVINTVSAGVSQTNFTVVGGYTPGFIDVYSNGVFLSPSKYTATDSSTVILNTGVTAGTELAFKVYSTINLGSISTATTITGLIAITNGGTGANTKTSGFNSLSPTTTKGDIIVNNGTDNVRVPVGTSGTALVADSTQPSGVKWGTPGITNVTTITGSTTLTATNLGSHVLNMASMGLSVTLPDATTLSIGGPRGIFKNSGGYPAGIRRSDGALITSVAPGGVAYLSIDDNSTAAGSWGVMGSGLEPGLLTMDNIFSGAYSAVTMLAPYIALDNDTSIHFAALASGFSAFVVDNAGKVVTTPVTVSTTASSVPSTIFKVSTTSAIVFFGSSTTDHQAVVLTVSGSSPSLSLSVGTAVSLGSVTMNAGVWDGEDFKNVPKIVQLSPGLYLSSYTTSSSNVMVVAISVSGSTITIGTSASTVTTSCTFKTTTTYALTSTTALVTYHSNPSPYTLWAVAISVSGTTCTVNTPVACPTVPGSTAGGYPISSVLLSSTKLLVLVDGNTTTAYVHACTISGASVSWGPAATIETGVSSFNASALSVYMFSLATRFNPHLWPIGANTAGLWYLDSNSISRVLILTEAAGVITAGPISYQSISGGANTGSGYIMPQGSGEFLSIRQQQSSAAGFGLSCVPSKITGTNIVSGSGIALRDLCQQPPSNVSAIKLVSGDYVIFSIANFGEGGPLYVVRSNGAVLNARGTIKVPPVGFNGSQFYGAVSSSRVVLSGSSTDGTTLGPTTNQLRLLNVEIAI